MYKNIFKLKRVVGVVIVLTFAMFFTTAAVCNADDGILQVTIEKSAQNPMVGIPVYLFNESGSYLGQHQITDSNGRVEFNLSEGTYKLRVDYLGYQFWSPVYTINGNLSEILTIAHQDVTLTVEGDYPSTEPIPNITVYLFTAAGSYLSQNQTTDANGQVVFNLPQQSYKFRTDYIGQQFWSAPFTWQDTTVTVPMADAEITVTGAGVPLEGVNVYVFTASGSYLSLNGTTNTEGKVTFNVPAGDYKFRADYQGSQYWSDPATLTAGQVNPVGISTGGGTLAFTVLKGLGVPLTSVNCYVFNETDSYLGMNDATDASGLVSFNLADGTYKIRVDYLGYQFWSPVYTVTGNLSETFTIAHQDVTLIVQGDYPSTEPISNIPVYLFTESGSYLSQNQTTDASGQVIFNLPQQSYKVRADYMSQQYWSSPFTWQDTTVTVPMADAEITVTGAAVPLEGVNVYVFTASGSYLSLNGVTNAEGKLTFNIPAGDYKFRADYQGSQYWSDPTTLTAGQVNSVGISTGGGSLAFTVLKGPGIPLSLVNCYVFSESGSYLNMSDGTDAAGLVSFNLADGTYKIRVDYLGYQFWSPVYTVTGNLDETFTISHQNVTITVQGDYPTIEPISGIPVYLFTESGSYLSQNPATNASGQVVFNIPQQSYKVRADYLGQQFWSDPFIWQDTTVTINQGMAAIHVIRSGSDVAGAKVYLFSESGTYLGRSKTTSESGVVEFLLPNTSFKFRIDEDGNQYWSPVVTIQAGTVNNVEVDISPITVNIIADPEVIQIEQSSTLSWNSTGANTCVIEPDIGAVDVNGSIQVSPEATTTYTITATGPGGTATDSVTVSIGIPPPILSASLDPETVNLGESSTLTWSTMYADSVILWTSIYGPSQTFNLPLSGSITDFPTQTTTFHMEATGPGGTTTYSGTVTVLSTPTVSISANPEIIQLGQSTTLTWNTTNADTCNIEPDVGSVDVNGSIAVSPTETTKYTITATGPEGTATDTIEVSVILASDPDSGIDPNSQLGGDGVVGERISILNGNSVESRLDLKFSSPNSLEFIFQATYNNQPDISGALGFGWSHTYSAVLDSAYNMAGQTYLKIIDQTGRAVYFKEETSGVYKGEFNEHSQVKAESGGYVWYRLDGSELGFSATGQLLWMDDEKDNRLVIGYDAQNRLQTVTDTSSGRALTFNYTAGGLLESISGPVTQAVPSGIWVTYGYDANQNLTSVTYADGSGFDYTYSDSNDVHNLTEKRDKVDHLLNTWAFDAQDRAVSSFTVKGKGVSIEYVNEAQVKVTDAYGTLRSYTLGEINGRKRVIAMQGPGGSPYTESNVKRWVYDSQMNLIEAETIGGTIYQYQNYDARGNPGTIILAYGTSEERVIAYTYHPDLNVPLTRTEASVIGSGNKETIFDYDDDGDAIPNESPTHLLYRVVEKGFTKDISGTIVPYEYITSFTHNDKGQILSIDGLLPGNGDTTSFSYNASTGDLLSITRPLIGSTGFSNYDAAGQAGQMTDVNGQSESFIYDGRGRITIITHLADGSASSVSYNTAGLPDYRTDEDGVISSFEYDAVYGRLARRIDHEGNYIAYNYDAQGNMIEKSYYDPTNNRTNWKRSVYQDPAHSMPGKLFKSINPDDTFTQYEYDSEGNIASVTDPNTNTTYYDYDVLNRLTTVSQPGSAITSYEYDVHGNLSSVMDAESHVTTYDYDDMGRVLTTTSPDTGTVAYAYDEAGNLTHKTDAKGITVVNAYDLLNRPTHVSFPDSSQDIGYTYDTGTYGIGRRAGMTDPSGSTTFGYDSRGRLVQKSCILDSYTYSTDRTFSPGGRVISTTYPSGRTVDYTRNSIGKISGVSTTGNGTTTTLINDLLYLPFGPSSGMSMGAGNGVTNIFDELYRTIVTNPGAQTERTYTYDANSNLTSINVTNDVSKDKTFTYDALNRLEHAEGLFGYIDYTYDHVGNRLIKVENNQTTYTYASGTNRLHEITGPVAFTYDANGNVIGIGNKVLSYNQNNRLVRVEEDSTILGEYGYNGLGQRISKTADGVTTIFLYDFDGNLIAESQDDGTIISEYLHRGASRLARVDVGNNEIYYFHNDHLGTPELMTDASGNAVWEAELKPFGEANVKSTSTVNNNFRLPGQIFDEDNGFHYNWHRYYDPTTGRYLTPDPSHFRQPKGSSTPYLLSSLLATPLEFNLYHYVLNNPINLIDPYGLFGIFGGKVIRVNAPGASLEASGRFIFGSEESGIRGSFAWRANATITGAGASAGRGPEAGFFLSDVSDFLKSNSINLDTPIGGATIFLDRDGKFLGAAIGGLSLGFGISFTGPDSPSIGWGDVWDLFNIGPSESSRDSETATPTIPEEYTPLPTPPLQYDPGNPDTIGRNNTITLSVIGGCPPYTWSILETESGFTLEKEEISTGPTNKLYADGTACGSATITVTGCDGEVVVGYVRCTFGAWINYTTLCMVDESGAAYCEATVGKYEYYYAVAIPYATGNPPNCDSCEHCPADYGCPTYDCILFLSYPDYAWRCRQTSAVARLEWGCE